jgi:succinate dehydrogenase/fumarate reductase flavoprotein subunit
MAHRSTAMKHYDVVVVGSGVAALSAVAELRRSAPDKTYVRTSVFPLAVVKHRWHAIF